jgi:leucyl aminopeptidase
MPSVSLIDPATPVKADAVIIGLVSTPDGPALASGAAAIDKALDGKLLPALKAVGASGKAGEVTTVPTFGLAPFPVIIAAGVGSDATPETFRRALGAAVRSAAKQAKLHVAVDGPVDALVEGALLGSYSFTAYKSAAAKSVLKSVAFAGTDRPALKRGKIVGDAVNLVRDLVNIPPNDLYPATFADRIAALGTDAGLAVEVLDERALKRGKYGAILAVGGGSARPPRLARLVYKPAKPVARIALVGKGITFDSGGLNLKTQMMEWMKSDMGGGAAVVAATIAAAQLKLPIEVIATVPIAENMPSGTSYRPSDVLTTRSGITIEVGNTDAEGRLILADGLHRAGEDDPDYLIDVATLTGAQLVSLGTRVIGAMGEPDWRDRVVAAGNATGEQSWAMPLPDELAGGLDSSVADIQNVAGDRWGGMLAAGIFLSRFMPDGVPWVHLDIAGPSWNAGGPRDYTPKGGTGAGVRTLLAAIQSLASA